MQKTQILSFVSLLRYALLENGEKPSANALSEAFPLAKAHGLDGALYSACNRAGYPEEILAPYLDAYHRTLYMNLKQEHERERILSLFEANGIDVMLLKGKELYEFYPSEFLRASSDIDLLISPEKMAPAGELLLSLGYEKGQESERDVTYHLGEVTLELHHALFARGSRFSLYFEDILTRSPLLNEKCHLHKMTEEDLLLYLLSHAYKHATSAGTGVRTVLDIGRVCEAHPTLLTDPDLLHDCSVLGLDAFLEAMLALYRHLLYGEQASEAIAELRDYILRSGAHGTLKNYAGRLSRGRGRLTYLLRRLFVPYSQMRFELPWCRHPLLYPVAFVARIFKTLLRGRARKHLSSLSYAKKEEGERVLSMWKSLGINLEM